jgi:hypothetical protein
MSRPRKDPRLVKVLAAIRSHGGPGHSPLYRWMRRHHDDLAAAFAKNPPTWGPLAEELSGVGLTDGDGKPPNAASTRQTWYRVRRDVARDRAQLPAAVPVPALAPDEIAPGVHAVAPVTASESAANGPRPRMSLDIRPARAAVAGPTVATGTTPTATDPSSGAVAQAPAPSSGESPAEQVRRLLAAMEVRKVPLPKIM